MNQDAILPLAAVGLGIVGLASLPGLSAIRTQIRNRTPRDNFYEDVDGKSTPEAIAAFSQKREKIAILVLASLSFDTSIAVSILSTLNVSHDGLLLVNWLSTATSVSVKLSPKDGHFILISDISCHRVSFSSSPLS